MYSYVKVKQFIEHPRVHRLIILQLYCQARLKHFEMFKCGSSLTFSE